MDVIICNPPPRAIKRRKKRSDLISNLPDHILIHILSFLPPDRAVLTCILSNRWRHLWTFTTNLTFAIDMPLQKFRNWYRSHDIVVKQCKFVSFVDKFLQLHCAPTVQKFRLCFGPLIEHVPLVENWIDLAMAKNVEQLELDFHYSNFVYYGDGELGQAAYGTPKLSRHPVFVSLKTLFLSNVKISDETFQVLVSNSPGIQSISLTDCVDLVHLRISSPNLSLKSLTVNECFWLEEIEICTPNLVSFQFQGHPAHFTLHDLRSLVDAMFIFVSGLGGIFSDSRYKRTTHGITKLLTDIAHVEILTISGHFLEFIVAAGKKLEGLLNPFCNLKELQLKLQMHLYERADLSVISCVISSCLNLERLFIDVGDNSRREQAFAEGYYPNAWPTSHFCVHHIKTVKITGFKGRCREIELVKLLLEKSKFIESLIIIVPQEISRKGYATELLRHAKELVRICQQLLSFPRASEVCRIVLFPSYEDTSLSPTHVLNSI